MATYKQYTQNTWFRGMNTDAQSSYDGQFQLGININPRNERGEVRLSSELERNEITNDDISHILKCEPICGDFATVYQLYDTDDDIYLNWMGQTVELTGLITGDTPNEIQICGFKDNVIISGSQRICICRLEYGEGGTELVYYLVTADTTPELARIPTGHSITCIYNFNDTYAMFGMGGVLLRYSPITDNPADDINWKIIRNWGREIVNNTQAETQYSIKGMTQNGNYLKVYVTNGDFTWVHYLQGTFDVEESGTYQSMKIDGLLMEGCIATDGNTDYGLFDVGDGDIALKEIYGFYTNTIRETQQWSDSSLYVKKLFYLDDLFPYSKLIVNEGTVYVTTREGIWSFKKFYMGSDIYVWGGVIEWSPTEEWAYNYPTSMFVSYGYIYVMMTSGCQGYYSTEYLYDADLGNHPLTYQPLGVLVGSVYTGGSIALFKKNVQATICGKVSPGNADLTLYYIYDREGLNPVEIGGNILEGAWRGPIKTMTLDLDYDDDYSRNIYDMIVPTTTEIFNQPRNTLEYAIKFEAAYRGDVCTQSPILYEHTLIYEDSMRKYRTPISQASN